MGYDTSILWPSTVNLNPLRDSYTEEMDLNGVTFKGGAGPGKRRRLATFSIDHPKFNLRLTQAEWTALKSWFRSTVFDGTLPFLAVNPFTNTTDTFFFELGTAPKIVGTKATSFVVAIELMKVADESLFDPIGDGSTFDIGDGSGGELRAI